MPSESPACAGLTKSGKVSVRATCSTWSRLVTTTCGDVFTPEMWAMYFIRTFGGSYSSALGPV
jgi:hypothetical protein